MKIMKIPPIVLVRKILFLLIGFDMTKSTLFFLKTKPNKVRDKATGINSNPK